METILELLKSDDYPLVWIQGHRTRIIFSKNSPSIEVRGRTGGFGTSYSVIEYSGDSESEATKAFRKSERK